jgi:hypothetical protein
VGPRSENDKRWKDPLLCKGSFLYQWYNTHQMNIFILDNSPVTSAEMMCDKHVVKMILESAQMLCSVQTTEAPYRRTHFNHPCTKWVRESKSNYQWLISHSYALCKEYTNRYLKVHKTQSVIDWCDVNRPVLPCGGLTPFAQAMPVKYKDENAVKAYRAYYLGEKSGFAKWKNGNQPSWYMV